MTGTPRTWRRPRHAECRILVGTGRRPASDGCTLHPSRRCAIQNALRARITRASAIPSPWHRMLWQRLHSKTTARRRSQEYRDNAGWRSLERDRMTPGSFCPASDGNPCPFAESGAVTRAVRASFRAAFGVKAPFRLFDSVRVKAPERLKATSRLPAQQSYPKWNQSKTPL